MISFFTISAIAIALPVIWLALVSSAGLLVRPKKTVTTTKDLSIAYIVPAHNEEVLIESTLSSLPEDGEVFVIADNCSDSTAELATKSGATVAVRSNAIEIGKGYALDWFLRAYDSELAKSDLLVILDADTQIDAAFPAELCCAFADEKVQAVQAYYGVANVEDGWRAQLSEVAFAFSHHLRKLGRTAIGGTAGLEGNGMAFRSKLLLDSGWPSHSLVEDLDFTIWLIERDIKVAYVPEARIYAEMATKKEAADSQRMRWEGGRLETIRTQGAQLLRSFAKTPRLAKLECLIDLIIPPLGLQVLVTLAAIGVFAALSQWIAITILATSLGLLAFLIVLSMAHRRVNRLVWTSLFRLPAFLAWKLCFYLKLVIFGKTNRWVRTQRNLEPTHPS